MPQGSEIYGLTLPADLNHREFRVAAFADVKRCRARDSAVTGKPGPLAELSKVEALARMQATQRVETGFAVFADERANPCASSRPHGAPRTPPPRRAYPIFSLAFREYILC
jgi:hypothetical protein